MEKLFYVVMQANCAVCRADDSGLTTLSSSSACKDLYGTQRIGIYGKIRSWKSVSSLWLVSFILLIQLSNYIFLFSKKVAILQMLEKQMGPESFRKVMVLVLENYEDILKFKDVRMIIDCAISCILTSSAR